MSSKGWELGHKLMDGGIRQVIDDKREGAGGKRWRVTCQSGQYGVIAMKKITPTLAPVKTIFQDTKMSSTTSCSCGIDLKLSPGFAPVWESYQRQLGCSQAGCGRWRCQ